MSLQWFVTVAQGSLQGRSLRLVSGVAVQASQGRSQCRQVLAVCHQVLRMRVRPRTVHQQRPPRGQVESPSRVVARGHWQGRCHRQAQAAQGRLCRSDRSQAPGRHQAGPHGGAMASVFSVRRARACGKAPGGPKEGRADSKGGYLPWELARARIYGIPPLCLGFPTLEFEVFPPRVPAM